MLQEEFSAAEEDNEGDELWLSKYQSSTVYNEQTSHTGEPWGNFSVHTVVNSTFTLATWFRKLRNLKVQNFFLQ